MRKTWFVGTDGVWHRQGYANIAACGALADRRAPWLYEPPSNGNVCDGPCDNRALL